MKRKIFLRALLGFPIGVCISCLIAILISLVMAEGKYYPVVSELTQLCGKESYSAAVQFLLSGTFGSIFAAASVVWEMDSWSILKMTFVHFIITAFSLLPIAYILYWMDHSFIGFASYFAVFIVIYVIIWFVQYISWYRSVDKINKKITDIYKTNNEKIKCMIPFLIVAAVMFNILPLASRLMNSIDATAFCGVFLLLIIFPLLVLVSSLILGIAKGICLLYPLCIAILFIPAIFIYYNDSAFIYMIVYAILALIGNLLGSFFTGRKEKHPSNTK